MNCPWCDVEATPRQLHAHLLERHAAKVQLEEEGSNRAYRIECPLCGDGYSHPIKPRLRDAGFVDEFGAEIRLVAFDMLVNHLLAEHETAEHPLPDIRPTGGASEP